MNKNNRKPEKSRDEKETTYSNASSSAQESNAHPRTSNGVNKSGKTGQTRKS